MINKISSAFLSVIKYIIFILAFVLFIFGVLMVNKRFNRAFIESYTLFIPMLLVFVTLIVNLFVKSKSIKENVLFNLISVIVFLSILFICARAKFDTSMIIYHKYAIGYNTLYFANNLQIIDILCYLIFGSNIVLYVSMFFEEKESAKNNDLKDVALPIVIGNSKIELKTNDNTAIVNEDNIDNKVSMSNNIVTDSVSDNEML